MGGIETDVAVVGGGPSGAVVARVLAAAGRGVAVFDAGSPVRPKFGEGLAPEAAELAGKLGLRDALDRDPLLARPCAGVASWWDEGEAPHRRHFRGNRGGAGWILDRCAFEDRLAAQARAAGAAWHGATRVGSLTRHGRHWRLAVEGPEGAQTVSARFVVDASGRHAVQARQLGATRHRYDKLVAVTARLAPGTRPVPEPGWIWVEAVKDGWWYSACVPDGHVHVALLTGADNAPLGALRTAEGFAAAMMEAPALRLRASDAQERCGTDRVRVCEVGTTRLVPMAGQGWVAVGDAAATFDPLSSQGLSNALASGYFAARATDAALSGDGDALQVYATAMAASHGNFLAQLPHRYDARPSSFWTSRAAVIREAVRGSLAGKPV